MSYRLWVEKYRPTNIDDYIFVNKKHKLPILEMIVKQQIPHLLLAGVQGCGRQTGFARLTRWTKGNSFRSAPAAINASMHVPMM